MHSIASETFSDFGWEPSAALRGGAPLAHSSRMSQNVAFVGVGRMGANMARRLKEQGFNVTAVYDLNETAARALAEELGSRAVTRLPEVTAAADTIITVVTDDASMHAVFAEHG